MLFESLGEGKFMKLDGKLWIIEAPTLSGRINEAVNCDLELNEIDEALSLNGRLTAAVVKLRRD